MILIHILYWVALIYCAFGLFNTYITWQALNNQEFVDEYSTKVTRLEMDMLHRNVPTILLVVFVTSPVLIVASLLGYKVKWQ